MGYTVHHTHSQSKDDPSTIVRALDYRPPELNTRDMLRSREYDVWTLGCVFLKMLTWFLGGNVERKRFKEDRREVDFRLYGNTRTFFTLTQRTNQSGIDATVEASVSDVRKTLPSIIIIIIVLTSYAIKWMDKVRHHEYRSQF